MTTQSISAGGREKIKGRQSLFAYIRYAVYLWNKNRKRYSWLWCPICDHDLNGDNDSFIEESKDRMFWSYKCANCGCESKFHLYGPVPLVHSHQVFTKNLVAYHDKT